MSALEKTVAAIRDVLLLRDQVSQMRGDIAHLAADVGGLVGDIRQVEQRLSRIEGFLEGRASAPDTPRQPLRR